MADRVVIEDEGDGWWDGPTTVECDVCWEQPGTLEGTLSEGRVLAAPFDDADA